MPEIKRRNHFDQMEELYSHRLMIDYDRNVLSPLFYVETFQGT